MDFTDIVKNLSDTDISENDYYDVNKFFKGKMYRIDETPTEQDWMLVPLFLHGVNGETRVWQIGLEKSDEGETYQLKTVHGIAITSKGIVGQNLQTSYHSVNDNKSGRNIQQQALLEARRKYMNKYKEGYLPEGQDLPPDLNGAKPMLAKTYHHPSSIVKNGPKIGTKVGTNETKITNFPISVMRKIDGIRALTRLHGNKITMRSRLNNIFPHLNHIKSEMDTYLKYLPPNCELDGELYSLNMSFQELTSAVKTVKEVHSKHHEVQYWIFDIIDPQNLVWEERYTMMVNAYIKYLDDGNTSNTFRILQAYTANSAEDIDRYHNTFVSEGYEGIIIRRYGSVEKDKKLAQYRPNRTNSLVKYKLFQDEEATIVGFEKCSGTEEGAIKFIVKDIRGNEFSVRPRGSIDNRCDWYIKGDQFIGSLLTIRYQELTDKGVPRFPVGICIRDYE